MKKIILLMILCLGVTINIFSQAKEITEDESVQQLVTSFGKLSGISLRRVTKEDFYKNGKLTKTTETFEYNPKDLKIEAPIK